MSLLYYLRPRRSSWGAIVFMVACAVLIAIVSRYYLIPALDAARHATPREKRWLAASSRLLLSVVLFVVLAGLLMVFRVGRFFFPRNPPPRVRTQYIDAWSESAKRLEPTKPPSQN
jgi:hypothetical protein